jgi:hypothetical protein
MAELLFAQLALILHRHRYATDNRAATQSETLLDKLLTELAGSLNRPFILELFCEREVQRACAASAVSPADRDDDQPLPASAAYLPRAVFIAAHRAVDW